ncbi:FAS1-like dehydratase domain-containing protein [Caulobacter sp. DWR1-3-2b1]|uniref:FAS1-like dehydratase domain-containing protein n=1 Tax=Caulobacter sp. DWR1-3-2b1 TaxID=2804670 RepID=UPI003CED5F19
MARMEDWIGRERRRVEVLAPGDLARLAAVLDRSATPLEVPPAWHWACAVETPRQSEIGPDGHPLRGGFMPPIEAPRRMFAAAEMRFEAPLLAGLETEWIERIASISEKAGKSGPLTFVEVERRISQGGALCRAETQTIVYRQPPAPGEAAPSPVAAPDDADWRVAITPDVTLLMRFSAATFNAHRIHYDRAYAMEVEGYPGLVVHGPLIALNLLEAMPPGRLVTSFSFRAVRPLFDGAPFEACGKLVDDGVELWARSVEGYLAMTARVEFAPSQSQ